MENSSSFAFVFLTIAILSALNLCSTGNVEVLCKEIERKALLRFKQDLKDPMNRLSSWDGKADCCRWSCVACHNITGHVLELHLGPHNNEIDEYEFHSIYKLGGELNPSLLSLKYLNYLDLSWNDFKRIHIPSFIGSLKSLTYLNLSNAGFGGIIPHQLGNLSNLRYLNLQGFSYYSLKVENFQFVRGLSWLQYLDMSGVSLRNVSDWLQVLNVLPSLVELRLQYCEIGYIPADVPAVINFTSLTTLDLSGNFLGPSMRSWIFNLNNLDSLYLRSVGLEGSFPFGLTNMTSRLKNLDLSANQLNSIIPHWMFAFNHLESLILFRSSLVGNIPSAIGNLTSIRVLDLSGNELEGEIPNSLGTLCRLKELGLYGNKLNGSISEVFERWSRCPMNNSIESLSLSVNKFSGQLSNHLGQLTNLVSLDITNNFFSGPIPTSIGKLSSLQYLYAASNQLNGSLPESFGYLVKLEELDISDNQLNGSLPESFGQLVGLEKLDISNNSFKGVLSEVHFINLTRLKLLEASRNSFTLKTSPNWVPPFQLDILRLNSWYLGPQLPVWIRWQQNLSQLYISDTRISDSLPTWFCNFSSQLGYLNLSRNQFHGEFPCTIHSLSTTIDLSSNHFNGSLPVLLSSIIEVLDLSNNLFSGSVFHFFCNKSDLQGYSYINLGNNLLSGAIPKCWKKWKNLNVLNLRDNNLDGVVPSSMGYLTGLYSLYLNNNNLSGELPLSLRKCTNMYTLDISANKFVGRIPKWIGISLLNLVILILHSNKFEGDIPLEVCNLKSLQILDLGHNNISGTIPKCFYNLSAMTTLGNSIYETSVYYYTGFDFVASDEVKLVIKGREVSYNTTLNLVRIIDLSDNNIHGGIPVELTRLVQLQTLNLSNNHLTGKIPSKIGNMNLLESLDLSRNQLHGEIPPSITNLTFLSYLDLSYNNFTGLIPTGTQLQSFNESSFIGNQLCGPPLHQNCSATEPTPTAGKQGGQGFSSEENYLYLSLGLGFAFGFWGLLGSLFFNTPWSIACCGFLDRIVLKLYAFIFENF